jgi:alkylated DNA repair dioxygenase AlkB
MALDAPQGDFFGGSEPQLPTGMVYEKDFLTPAEEAALLPEIAALPLTEARYKQYTARRRTVSYGSQYDFSSNELEPAAHIPEFLFPLRAKIAAWLGLPAEHFVHALVSEYRPGTPLGWHRDVPDFESIVGVSVQGSAVMKFRRYPHAVGDRSRALRLELPPRSLYVIEGEARWGWQHSVAPVRELRHSITLRTRRGSAPLRARALDSR